jgi:hypothetical protein
LPAPPNAVCILWKSCSASWPDDDKQNMSVKTAKPTRESTRGIPMLLADTAAQDSVPSRGMRRSDFCRGRGLSYSTLDPRREAAHSSGGIKGARLSQSLRLSLSAEEVSPNSVQPEKSPAQQTLSPCRRDRLQHRPARITANRLCHALHSDGRVRLRCCCHSIVHLRAVHA